MPTVTLTDVSVAKIKTPPQPNRIDYWDEKIQGLGLRVSYNGTKTWLASVRILNNGEWKKTRVTLGRYPVMTLKDARINAQGIKYKIKQGIDPRDEPKKEKAKVEQDSKDSFGAVRERFLKQRCKNLKDSTAKEYSRVLRSKVFQSLEQKPISTITKKEIVEVIDKAAETAPVGANRALNYLKIMMNWSVKRDIIQHSPAMLIDSPTRETSRDRVLTDTEIRLALKAFDEDILFGPICKLLLLTGARRSEVSDMTQSELTLDGNDPLWIIPSDRTKNSREHRVPLTPMMIDIIKSVPRIEGSNLLFTTNGITPVSGWTRAKDRSKTRIAEFMKEEDITSAFDKDWTYHDLRRTMATHLAEMGVSRDVVELLINHKSGSRRGIVAVYNRSELLTERRKALILWSNRVQKIVSGKKDANNLIRIK